MFGSLEIMYPIRIISYKEKQRVITVIIKESRAMIHAMLPVPNIVNIKTKIAIIGRAITATFIELMIKIGFNNLLNLVNSA